MFALLGAFISTILGGTTVAAAAATTYALYAAVAVAGVSIARRQQRRAERAYQSALKDRTITAASSDAPCPIVYGRARVGGTQLYVLSPTPEQQYFYMVLGLSLGEVDGLEAVYAGDELVPLDANGNADVTRPGRFARVDPLEGVALIEGVTVATDGAMEIALNEYDQVVGVAIQPAPYQGVDGVIESTFVDVPDFVQLEKSVRFPVPTVYDGRPYRIAYVRRTPKSFIRITFYRGTTDQVADAELKAASNGEWDDSCRLRGRCYAIVRIDPDPDVFADGLPNFSFVIRGRRLQRTGAYSENPALQIEDYLRRDARFPVSAINEPAVLAAASACDESIRISPSESGPRYVGHGLISTESTHRDNVESMMSAMAGTLVPEGGNLVLRAGVYEPPAVTLDASDIIGPVSVSAYPSSDATYNTVRGRYIEGVTLRAGGIVSGLITFDAQSFRNPSWQWTDFKPFTSPRALLEDNGVVTAKEIDLPFTIDPRRAQRLARLDLYQGRDALRISATAKTAALGVYAGKTVRLKLPRYGWAGPDLDGIDGKVFRVLEHTINTDFSVNFVAREENSALYAFDYLSESEPPTADNTNLPTFTTVDPIAGLAAESGPAFVQQSPGGPVRPYVLVTWDQVTDPAVLTGGQIEFEWQRIGELQWQQLRLDPYTTRLPIFDVTGGEQLVVRVRAFNARRYFSQWSYLGAAVDPLTPSPIDPGAVLNRPNILQERNFFAAVTPWRFLKGGGTSVTVETANAGDGFYRGGGVNSPNTRPAPYGSLIWAGTGGSGIGGRLESERFSVRPGEILEVHALVAGVNCLLEPPVIWVWNAVALIESSAVSIEQNRADEVYVTYPRGPLVESDGITLESKYRQVGMFFRVPLANAAIQAQISFRCLYRNPANAAYLVVAQPFVARHGFGASVARIRSISDAGRAIGRQLSPFN